MYDAANRRIDPKARMYFFLLKFLIKSFAEADIPVIPSNQITSPDIKGYAAFIHGYDAR